MGLILLSISINIPKEATHTEIKLSSDTGPLLPAEWKSLGGGRTPGAPCLHQHLAQQGPYFYGSFSPSVPFFSLSLPHDEGFKNVC